MAEAAAVIPNWNGARMLPRAIESLRAQTMPLDIIVVDNGSTDGSDAAAERAGARVIRMGENTGFARAVNRGVSECAGPLVAIVNNDVELEPDWLERLASAVSRPGVWFATGKLVSAARRDRIDATFDAVSRAGCAWRCGQGSAADRDIWNEARAIAMAPLTAALFRRDAYLRVGGLDERFESFLEDVDLGLRLSLEGLGGRYVPLARGAHHGGATLGAWSPAMVRLVSRNQVFLVAKHYARSWNAGAIWRVIAGQLLWGLVAARHGAGGAWLRGKWEGLSRFGEFGAPSPRIHQVMGESERLLADMQRAAGLDTYWRLYFALT